MATTNRPSPEHIEGEHAWLVSNGARALKVVLALAAVLFSFWLGTKVTSSVPGSTSVDLGKVQGQAEYWTCSMHPEIRQPGPGQCPICGMELIPVTKATEAPKVKKAKYACAMVCLPPLDHPGECPVCGMEMVAVETGGDGSDAPSGPHTISEITLTPAAQKLAKLAVAPVEKKFVFAEIRMVGKVDYDETRQRTITARVPGRLDRLYVNYTGIPVKKGEHLVYLYSPDLLAAQSELIELIRATRDLPASAAGPAGARNDWLEAARQKLRLWGLTSEQIAEIEQRGTPSDHLTVYAPIGGIVTDKKVVEGAYVEVGTEIYTIADLSHLWIKLDAYEMDLAWLRYGQDVECGTEAYPGEVFHGTIAFIDPVLNETTRTAKVRVNVSNEDGRLKPGMFVRALVRSRLSADGSVLMESDLAGKWVCPMHPEIVSDGPGDCSDCGMPLVTAESLGYSSASPHEAEPPLVIPISAPLITGKRALAYVADSNEPGRYEGREIVLGPRAADYYVVRDGLAEGEMVVVHGNLYLDSAVQIRGRQSMMQPQASASTGLYPWPIDSTPESASHGGPTSAAAPDDLPAEFNPQLAAVFDAYFAAHSALKADHLEPAQSAAKQLSHAASASGVDLPKPLGSEWSSLRERLRKHSDGIASAADIAAARAAFEGASGSVIAMAKRFGVANRERVLVYHCPMAFNDRGADWLQEREGVENPYFGSVMFRCGVLKETIAKSGLPDGGND